MQKIKTNQNQKNSEAFKISQEKKPISHAKVNLLKGIQQKTKKSIRRHV